MNNKEFSNLPHILVIDDEEGMRVSLKRLLQKNNFNVMTAKSAKEGLTILQNYKINLIICDIVMPDMGGLIFLSKIGNKIPVIMITAYASIETARKAFKLGAFDYLVKPFDIEELLVIIEQCLDYNNNEDFYTHQSKFIKSKNPNFIRMLSFAERFSVTDMPILIIGESGTGKEVIANYIYEKSRRNKLPFLKINCAAIPESLLESELFGYERGAFTGAHERKIGKFEEANGGTIFFDEIGDMAFALQAKILRVLQDFEFTRIGGSKDIHVDCRIIAATNHNISILVKKEKFREDLFHRLNGVSLYIPPLRERIEDIKDFSNFFLRVFTKKYNKDIKYINEDTIAILNNYHWPGNIRELKNCVERAVVICDEDCIFPHHLPDSVFKRDSITDDIYSLDIHKQVKEYRDNYTRELILKILEKSKGNKTDAAKTLRISRKTLYKWMKEYNIKHEYI